MSDDGDTLRLEGRMTVREVPALAERHEAAFHGTSMPRTICLKDVESVDSSALALLLDWQARAHDADRGLRFQHPPKGLRVIARLTGVAPLLGWEDDDDHEESAKESP